MSKNILNINSKLYIVSSSLLDTNSKQKSSLNSIIKSTRTTIILKGNSNHKNNDNRKHI